MAPAINDVFIRLIECNPYTYHLRSSFFFHPYLFSHLTNWQRSLLLTRTYTNWLARTLFVAQTIGIIFVYMDGIDCLLICVCVWMSLCWLSKFDAVPHQQQLLLWTAKYRSFVFFSFSCCHFHMHSWKYSSVPAQLPLLFRRCTFVIIESTITSCDDCCSSRHHHRQANAIIIMIDWTVKYLYVSRCCAEWFIHLPIV